jgi:hypothetical protein
MIQNIKIVSDGSSTGTLVFGPNGEKLSGITAIHIDPITVGNPIVVAHLTFVGVALELEAETK